jgi:hypothetical protein
MLVHQLHHAAQKGLDVAESRLPVLQFSNMIQRVRQPVYMSGACIFCIFGGFADISSTAASCHGAWFQLHHGCAEGPRGCCVQAASAAASNGRDDSNGLTACLCVS